MPRGTIDWKSTQSYTRLLAAIMASEDMKLNYKKIADMYGNGATYDAIEGRFRIIKKEAAKLKEEIDNGLRPEAPARANNTPRKRPSEGMSHSEKKPIKGAVLTTGKGVITGRITKPSTGSPTKKRPVKKELHEALATSDSYESGSFPSSDNGYTDDGSFNAYDDPSVATLSFEHLQQLDSADPLQYMMPDIGDWNDEHVV